jgi:hypothetical protein
MDIKGCSFDLSLSGLPSATMRANARLVAERVWPPTRGVAVDVDIARLVTQPGQNTSSPGVPVIRSARIVSGLDRYGSRIPRIGLRQHGDEREGDEA